MQGIIDLLKKKNDYLHNFFAINENELLNFADGNFENLEGFYMTRDKILEYIRQVDAQITEAQKSYEKSFQASDNEKKEIAGLLRKKEEMVKEILSQDLQILAKIDEIKSDLLKEMRSVKKAKKALQGYHSGNYSKHVDEKA